MMERLPAAVDAVGGEDAMLDSRFDVVVNRVGVGLITDVVMVS